MHHRKRYLLLISLLCLFIGACSSSSLEATQQVPKQSSTPASTQSPITATPQPFPTDTTANDVCPANISTPSCQTPQSMRIAYGVAPLIAKGFTGKGQTLVDIVSFGSPTLQADMDVFDKQFGLPAITIQQISPLKEPVSDPHNDRAGWAAETTLDVEIMHAMAPDAGIVVLSSPVAETEGTLGLPEFRQLVQYTIDHKLGNIVSQSWGASEQTLKDAKGQAELQLWDALFKKATTQDGLTFFSSSGDNGATDYMDINATQLSPTPTTSFPADDAWVTSVGGTTLNRTGSSFSELAWSDSGGGFSSFFPTPTYQQALPASVQSQLKNKRGVPDVAGNADPETGLAMYEDGSWGTAGGTSASAPLWASLMAIADQMAGHALGFINTSLYKIAGSSHYHQDFYDTTAGNNSVDSDGVVIKGYNAVAGWDAVTGLGSPNASQLLPDLIADAQS